MNDYMNATSSHACPQAVRDLLRSHIVAATIEILRDWSSVEPLGADEELPIDGNDVVALIGFSGDSLRGVLAFALSASQADALVPGVPLTDEGRCDVVGEFSNLLLGRLKSRLLAQKIRISLAIPTTSRAVDTRFAPDGLSISQAFSSPHGRLVVRVDAVADPDLVIGAAPADCEIPDPGDVLFF